MSSAVISCVFDDEDDFLHIHGNMFSVPFESIVFEDEQDLDESVSSNPRMLTKFGTDEAFDKEKSFRLREDIKRKTLLCPLVCRWVQKDGKMVPKLVGGERRYRALSYLRQKNELVADPNNTQVNSNSGSYEYKYIPAKDAYDKVVCHVFHVNSDLEALELAWSENKNRINLTDGHEIAQVIKLRKHDVSDENIMKILQRDAKWLAQTEKLIGDLEDDVLEDVIEGKMTRSSAIELSSIKDPDQRKLVKEAAAQIAVEITEEKQQAAMKKVNKAVNLFEEIEVELIDAKEADIDDETIEEIEEKKKTAQNEIKKAVENKNSIAPVVRPKQVKQAKQEVLGEEEGTIPKILSSKKIVGCIAYLENVIHNKGQCKLYKYQADVSVLELIRDVLKNNVASNDEEIGLTIMDFYEEK